jgi:ankyrin repeat protein
MNYLIEKNVDVNLGKHFYSGTTALELAIHNRSIDKINILIQAGANVNIINDNDKQKLLELLK